MADCGGLWAATEGGHDEDGFWDSEDEHVCCLEAGHEDDGIYHICARHAACWPSPWAALPRSSDAAA